MAKNQSTYTLNIDAELSGLHKVLNEAKTSLTSFMSNSNAPKGLEKAFERINTLLGQISDKTGKPLDIKGLTSTGKDLTVVQDSFRSIIRLLGEFDELSDDLKLSFLSADEQKAITSITNALKNYGIAAEEASKKVKAFETAQKGLLKEEAALGRAKKSVGSIESKRNTKQAELSGAIGKLEAASGGESFNPEKVANYQAKVTRLRAELENLNRAYDDANEQLVTAQASYDAAARSVAALGRESDKASKESLKQLKEEAKGLGISLEGLNGHNAAKQVEMLTQRMEEFRAKIMKGAKPAFETITHGCEKAGKAVAKLQDDVSEATETVKEMDEAAQQRDAFETKIKSFLGLSGAAQLMRSAIQDALSTIKELDATMTEMAVVTDLSVGDYWDQLPEYSMRANELGVAINDVYKSATLYYQQGLNTQEVTALSNQTLKMARIANIDAADATDKMTAALRGFNMELNEASAQRVSDVYSELAAITAASTKEIANAMTKTASIASSAGMEFETTAAFLSQIIETTRESAETAGTAMKTVIARFQELKKAPGEIGEIDGEIVDANAIETALRSVGVSLRDTSGQFRNLDEVFLELSSKWDTLDKNTQRYIATIAAGSRQQSRFIAMMSDYKRTQELVTAANTSAGASNEQFEKTLESLDAKVERLKNSWHQFTMGIVNSDLIKVGVDILNKLLEIINKATEGFDSLSGSILKIGTVFGIFKLGTKIFDKFRDPMRKFFTDIVVEAGKTGEKAAQSFKAGAERGNQKSLPKSSKMKLAQGYTMDANGRIHRSNGTLARKGEGIEEKTRSELRKERLSQLGQATGVSNVAGGLKELNALSKERKETEEQLGAAIQNREKAQAELNELEAGGASEEEIQAKKRELEGYNAEIIKQEQRSQELAGKSKDAWGTIGKGIGQAGKALTGFGMGLSMVGGVLSSLGLEEFGENLSKVGQAISLIGTLLSAIPPILTMITAHPIIALITLIVGVVLGSIVAMVSYLDSISASSKLEDAIENARAAEEAASAAKDAFEQLNSSIDNLGAQYDSLNELRKGTDEWNKSVQEVNDSVLSLIESYPELAAFVKNEGGVLTLDVNSEGVQKVIKDYESKSITQQGVAIASKANVARANKTKAFSDLSGVNEIASDRGWDTFFKHLDTGIQAGMASATLAGADPLSLIAGAFAGALTGATTGAINGFVVAGQAKTDKKLQEATEALAEEIADGRVETMEQMLAFLTDEKGIDPAEAKKLARSFSSNYEEMLKYGQELAKYNQQEAIYYAAQTENAKQLIDLNKYTLEEQAQMTNAMTADLWKSYEDELYSQVDSMSKEEMEQAQADYVAKTFGEGHRIDGNKVLDSAGNTVRDFADDDAWKEAIIAANAMEKAAEAMGKLPEIIDKVSAQLEDNFTRAGDVLNQAFSEGASSLTKSQADQIAKMIDSGELKTFWENNQDLLADTYEDFETFAKTFTNISDAAKTGFEKASIAANKLNITLNEGFSMDAAQGWTNSLFKMSMSGADTSWLNNAFNNLGLTSEDMNKAMGAINAIDQSSIMGWQSLQDVFDNLGIEIGTQKLQEFIDTAIETSNAVNKIDFTNFTSQIKKAYEALDAIEGNNRVYKEETYKSLVSFNSTLSKNFMQVGEDFVYLGGSMQELKEAIEQQTIASRQTANNRLLELEQIATFIKNRESITVSGLDDTGLRQYLSEVRDEIFAAGLDLSTLGEVGLSNTTDFYSADIAESVLKGWAEAIESQRGNLDVYAIDYAKSMSEANILAFTKNLASYNAKMATESKDYSSDYQQALLLQAVQSGGVNNALIEKYQEAINLLNQELAKGKDANDALVKQYKGSVKEIGEKIANAAEMIVESSEGRDQYSKLIDKTTEAIKNLRTEEIEKLTAINDTINETNGNIVARLQEQINAERQARQNEEKEQELGELYNRLMLLENTNGSDTEIAELRQQITNQEKDYQDTLVDQAIQNLTDANERAAEQRERQINLLNQQLQSEEKSGQIAKEAKDLVDSALTELQDGVAIDQTSMGQILYKAEGANLGEIAKADWASNLATMATKATEWFIQQGIETEASGETDKKLMGAQTAAQAEINNKQYTNLETGAGADLVQSHFKKYQENGGTADLDTFKKGLTGYDPAVSEKAKQGEIMQTAISALGSERIMSQDEAQKNATMMNLARQYQAANGNVEAFWNNLKGKYALNKEDEGAIGVSVSGWDEAENRWFDLYLYGEGDDVYPNELVETGHKASIGSKLDAIWETTHTEPMEISGAKAVVYEDRLYVKNGGSWFEVLNQGANLGESAWCRPGVSIRYAKEFRKSMSQYKAGGIADFTGPAWLDGTPSKPEYVLNAQQTERFFSLIDVLENYSSDSSARSSGDNYFEIAINVDKIDSDYDVERMAEKIRNMIYDDATYRNVNTINLVR